MKVSVLGKSHIALALRQPDEATQSSVKNSKALDLAC